MAEGAELHLDGPPGEVIEAVWAEALGVETIDPHAGFFDLGASSVIVLEVVRTLRRRWPQLRIADVFSHATAAQLASYLDDGDGGDRARAQAS